MANQYGIDIGEVYRTAEAVKSARQNRENNALLMDWKKEDREIARARGNALGQLRSRAASGEPGAMAELIAFDPEQGASVLDAIGKMTEQERKKTQEGIDQIGRVAAYVLNSDNPEQAYQIALRNISPDISAGMPESFDANYVQMQLAQARELDDLLANPEKLTMGAEDLLYKDGRVIGRATSSAELDRQNSRGNALIRANSQGGAGGVKSADESLMYRQAGELLGGLFDQQGNLQNLDPSTRGKVQAIATEAANIYQGGGVSRSQAVTQAARKLGITVQNLGQGGTLDRNQLLQQYSQ